MKNTKTPYETVIQRFKGASRLAAATGIPRTTILRWKDRGFIPAQHMARVLAAAKHLGIGLTLEDVVYGEAENGAVPTRIAA